MKSFNIIITNPAINADIGSVITHVVTILIATPQFTPLNRLDDPTPKMADEETWVVDTGSPIMVAPCNTANAVKSAANPLIGFTLKIFFATVLIIRIPPIIVPKPIVPAQRTCTQNGTSNVDWKPPATKAKTIIPIVFGHHFLHEKMRLTQRR